MFTFYLTYFMATVNPAACRAIFSARHCYNAAEKTSSTLIELKRFYWFICLSELLFWTFCPSAYEKAWQNYRSSFTWSFHQTLLFVHSEYLNPSYHEWGDRNWETMSLVYHLNHLDQGTGMKRRLLYKKAGQCRSWKSKPGTGYSKMIGTLEKIGHAEVKVRSVRTDWGTEK